MFKRNFREKGAIHLGTYLKTYRVGDIVDIKANAAQQKGMPHKVRLHQEMCIGGSKLIRRPFKVLPRPDRDRLQRHPCGRRRYRLQSRRQPVP